jgi:Rrf2 family protein
MFSKTFGYALRATVYVAIHGTSDKKVGLQEVSERLNIPHHFLGKIMQDLVRHGIIDSTKGPSGGFFVNAATLDVPLIDILKITDGNLVFNQCALGITRCNAQSPCPLHDDFASCRNGMIQSLAEKTVGILAEEVEAGRSFLVR